MLRDTARDFFEKVCLSSSVKFRTIVGRRPPNGYSVYEWPNDFVHIGYSVRYVMKNGSPDVTNAFNMPVYRIMYGKHRSIEMMNRIVSSKAREFYLYHKFTNFVMRHNSVYLQ
jgi:hypothetical protein